MNPPKKILIKQCDLHAKMRQSSPACAPDLSKLINKEGSVEHPITATYGSFYNVLKIGGSLLKNIKHS